MDLVAIYRGPYCHSMYNACPPCRNGTYIPWRAWFQRREVDLGDGFSSEIWYVCSLFSNMFLGGFEKGVKLCMKNVPWTIRMKKSLVSSVVLFSPRSLGKIPILTSICFKWGGSTTTKKSLVFVQLLKPIDLLYLQNSPWFSNELWTIFRRWSVLKWPKTIDEEHPCLKISTTKQGRLPLPTHVFSMNFVAVGFSCKMEMMSNLELRILVVQISAGLGGVKVVTEAVFCFCSCCWCWCCLVAGQL